MNIEYLILLIVIIISILLVFKNSYEKFSLLKLNEANFRTIGSDGKVYNVTDADRLKMAKKLLNLIVTNDKSVDFAKNLYLKSLPKGSIIIWKGSTIPKGWFLCDGKNGTPDLRNRIPVGRGTKRDKVKAGFQGGQPKYISGGGHVHGFKLTSNELPSHTHSISARVTDRGRHSHSVTTDDGDLHITGTLYRNSTNTTNLYQGDNDGPGDGHRYYKWNHSHRVGVGNKVVFSENDATITTTNVGKGTEKKFTIKMPQYVTAYFIQKNN